MCNCKQNSEDDWLNPLAYKSELKVTSVFSLSFLILLTLILRVHRWQFILLKAFISSLMLLERSWYRSISCVRHCLCCICSYRWQRFIAPPFLSDLSSVHTYIQHQLHKLLMFSLQLTNWCKYSCIIMYNWMFLYTMLIINKAYLKAVLYLLIFVIEAHIRSFWLMLQV